jgi:hypothetical protein
MRKLTPAAGGVVRAGPSPEHGCQGVDRGSWAARDANRHP